MSPERASAVVSHGDDAPPRGPDQASMREAVLMAPFAFLQAHFPEADGFQYVTGPFCREICYTEKNEGGEEVAVTIPGDDTWVFQAARRGAPPTRARVDGIKQGGAVCFILSTLPPELDMRSDAAFSAAEQALLETIRGLQSSDFEGSRPVPDWWLEGCLAIVYMGGKPRLYEYSKAKGLCEPQANTGWMLLKADEELRRTHGLPLHPLLRDVAESLSEARSEPPRERADSPKHAGWSDPFPGVATPDKFALSFYEHRFPKPAENDVTSLYNLREMAMKIPLSYFQGRWPKEDGFDHLVAGFLERDIHYTELRLKEGGGEEVTVTIPSENTHLYVLLDKNRARITCIALYAMPPAPAPAPAIAPSSESKNAETPAWGRDISGVAMDAVARELQEFIKKFRDVGYNGAPPAGKDLDGCLALVFVGLEFGVGVYNSREEGFSWSVRGPAVPDGHGLAAASDPSNYRILKSL